MSSKLLSPWLLVLAIPAFFVASCEFEGASNNETFTWLDTLDRSLNVTISLAVDGERVEIQQPIICSRIFMFGTNEWAALGRRWIDADFSHDLGGGNSLLVSFSPANSFSDYPIRELCDAEKPVVLRWGDPLLPRIGWMGDSPIGTVIESYQLLLNQTDKDSVMGGHVDVGSIEVRVEPDGWVGFLPNNSTNTAAGWFNNDSYENISRKTYNDLFIGFRAWQIPKSSWSGVPRLAAAIAAQKSSAVIELEWDREVDGEFNAGSSPVYTYLANSEGEGKGKYKSESLSYDIAPLLPDMNREVLYWKPALRNGFDLYFSPNFKRIPASPGNGYSGKTMLFNFYKRVEGLGIDDFAAEGDPLFYKVVAGDLNLHWDMNKLGNAAYKEPVFYDPMTESIVVLHMLPFLPN